MSCVRITSPHCAHAWRALLELVYTGRLTVRPSYYRHCLELLDLLQLRVVQQQLVASCRRKHDALVRKKQRLMNDQAIARALDHHNSSFLDAAADGSEVNNDDVTASDSDSNWAVTVAGAQQTLY